MTQDLQWRGYRIIAATIKGAAAAQVYLGKVRATAERFTGETETAAIEAARAWIDARLSERFASRRAPHVATADEYADYFTANRLRLHERLMLAAHVEAETMTAGELAAAAGWESYGSANIHYGWLAREVAQTLGLAVPAGDSTGDPVWTYALADEAERSPAGEFRWRIHPELVEGLRQSGALA